MILIFSFPSLKREPFPLMTVSGTKGVNGSWKNECRVIPPALIAAMPVGAKTIMRLGESSFKRRKKAVFPVPAFPVKKRDMPVSSTICRARCHSELMSKVITNEIMLLNAKNHKPVSSSAVSFTCQ